MSSARLQVCLDPAATAAAAASYIATAITERLRVAANFSVALSGGTTPKLMLARLTDESLEWDRLQVFQVDERVAPAGDPARNLNLIKDAVVTPGFLPVENLHPMPVEAISAHSDAAADRYAQSLCQRLNTPPILDLVHLGLGDDGHTASLIPGRPEIDREDCDVLLTDLYQGHRRMTLSLPILNRARHRVWLVTGANKAAMLARLYAGDQSIPAGRLSSAKTVIFADTAAAAGLT
ncbi:MAG: 6-phosphogluconolactonase [Pseudomonadota bacterium]